MNLITTSHMKFFRCLTLDERRIEARKICNLGCVKEKSKDWKPISSIPADPGKYFFANVLAPILSDVRGKVRFFYFQLTPRCLEKKL